MTVSRGRTGGSRFRRKVVVAVGLVVVTIAAAIPVLAGVSGADSAIPSSDINDYALYAVGTLQMKGQGSTVTGNIAAGTRHYMPGDIDEYANGKEFLANNGSGPPNATGDNHLNICQGANPRTTITGYAVAPSSNITYMKPTAANPSDLNPADPCQVPKLYTKVVSGPTAPANVWSASFAYPDIKLPTLAAFEPGISTACDTSITRTVSAGAGLAPGVYGSISIDHTTVLSAGDYTFCNLTVQQGATLVTTDQTRIYVSVGFRDQGGANGNFGTPGTKVYVAGTTLNFGRGGNVSGTFLAPNADVSLGNATDIIGHVWSLAMHSDWSIQVTQGPPPTPTTTTSTSTTATTNTTSTTTIPVTTTTTIPGTTTTTTIPDTTTTTTIPDTTTTTTVTIPDSTTTTTFRF